MDRSVSPWRTLDGSPPDAADNPTAADHPTFRWPLVGGAIAAAGVALVALAIVASGPHPAAVVGVGVDQAAAVASPAGPNASSRAPIASAGTIVVHVAGAVRRPGLVRLPPGARIADAIEAAGGLGPRVDAGRVDRDLNLAEPLRDGDHIVVPSRDDPATSSPAAAAKASGGPIDLNHASAEALDALPGIGPATAAKIIAAREERPFVTLDELVARKVLGQATLTKIRDLVELR